MGLARLRTEDILRCVEAGRLSPESAAAQIADEFQDDRLFQYAEHCAHKVRDGWNHPAYAAKAIEEEQDYWERKDRERMAKP